MIGTNIKFPAFRPPTDGLSEPKEKVTQRRYPSADGRKEKNTIIYRGTLLISETGF